MRLNWTCELEPYTLTLWKLYASESTLDSLERHYLVG